MPKKIKSIAVIGAGTMGAAIAAHCANAGYPALLLDIVPTQLTEEEVAKGLTLDSPQVKNRIVQDGFERLTKARPAAMMHQNVAKLITLGNLEADFGKLAEVDWVIEVIIEKLEPKQALMARIEAVCKPGTLVTTNTSGLPIASISQGRSELFKQHFLGTHFFNPVRYMKLLEIIPTSDTDPEVVKQIATFGEDVLGKGAVFCKDTPNFIGNRLFSIGNCFAADYAIRNGYTVTEADTLTGPLLGRPKTGTFRLQDLIGIDIAAYVAQNLYNLIPHDPYRDILMSPDLGKSTKQMLDNKWLGNKTRQGYYKKGKDEQGNRVFLTLNPTTFEYEMPDKARFEAVGAVREIEDLGERVRALLDDKWADDRGARFVRDILSYELAYAAHCAPEIAHDLKSIDDTIRWGFAFEAGPFQLWDKLGVADMAAKIEAAGQTVAPWVKEMLEAGITHFYQVDNGTIVGVYDWESKQYKALPANPKHLKVATLRAQKEPLLSNESASLHDMGDGVLLLEFHTKANAIDHKIVELMTKTNQLLQTNDDYVGMVIGNDGDHFCAGANIFEFVMAAKAGQFEVIDQMVKSLQDALMAYRFSQKPVVVALHGRALGGGAEVVMGASRVVAHVESYVGLVEIGVGVIPAGCGTMELTKRILSKGMQVQQTDPLPLAQTVFETIGLAKVGTSADESAELGYLRSTDRIVMNRDNLLYEAKQEVLNMVMEDYTPPVREKIYAGGRDLLAAMKMGLWTMQQSGFISEHDQMIGENLAYIICGGNLSAPQWVDPQHFLDLERKLFIALAGTEKTQARIWHMLKTKKPLRN